MIAAFSLSASLFSLGGILFVCGAAVGVGMTLSGFVVANRRDNYIADREIIIRDRVENEGQTLMKAFGIFKRRHPPVVATENEGYKTPPLRLSNLDL